MGGVVWCRDVSICLTLLQLYQLSVKVKANPDIQDIYNNILTKHTWN